MIPVLINFLLTAREISVTTCTQNIGNYTIEESQTTTNLTSYYNITCRDEYTNIFIPNNTTCLPLNETDPYANDPPRDARLISRSTKPYNGESPSNLLLDRFYTPNEIFYVRNNLPVPCVEVGNYSLEIGGINLTTVQLTLRQLTTLFSPMTIAAVLQCAGNRRSEMNRVKPVSGTKWTGGAIGNANWTGANLRDILAFAGFQRVNYSPDVLNTLHMQLTGLDQDPKTGTYYGASIPVSYILDDNFTPLVAYGMNGESLTRDHGFPVRAILPGIVGARNVKWLQKITLATQEAQTIYQLEKYKAFSPSITSATVTHEDYNNTDPIMDLPVTSYLTSHTDMQLVQNGTTLVEGYACSGAGRHIQRVELSQDLGKNWIVAEVTERNSRKLLRNWSWVFWRSNVSLSVGRNEIWVKAVDSGYNQQPQEIKDVWNFDGYLNVAYHKVVLIAN